MQPLSITRLMMGAIALAFLPLVSLAGTAAAQTAPTYVRAKASAQVRNFEDKQGLVVRTLEEGHLLRAYATSEGRDKFYQVEIAGGVPVWVYGKYLQATTTEGVLLVNGSRVNMRPRPNSDIDSMPLRTRLESGDRVEFIERRDPAIPLAEDWVKVWAPERARAWVLVSQTTAEPNASAAAAEWKTLMRVLPQAPAAAKPGPGKPKPIQETGPRVPKAAREALAKADALFDEVRQREAPASTDYAPVREAYQDVIDLAPVGSHERDLALRQLQMTDAQTKLCELREEVQQANARREQRMRELAEEQRKVDLENTDSWGRFVGRGWIEREIQNQVPRYFLRWGGERTAEIVCGSGRYDLSIFRGYQIGVQGTTRRAAVEPSLENPGGQLRQLDVTRLEVIQGGRIPR